MLSRPCLGPPDPGGPPRGQKHRPPYQISFLPSNAGTLSRNCETRKKIYKTKVVWKVRFSGGKSYFLGPKSRSGRTWAPCASGAMVKNFQATFNIQNVWYSFPVVNLVKSRPPRPSLDPKPGVGGPKQGLEKIYCLNFDTTLINFIKQKL
jgi:hypothetical protein